MVHAFCVLRNLHLTQGHKDFSPLFSSKRVIVLDFIFQSMIHFEFVCLRVSVWCKIRIEVLFLHVDIQLAQYHLLE